MTEINIKNFYICEPRSCWILYAVVWTV